MGSVLPCFLRCGEITTTAPYDGSTISVTTDDHSNPSLLSVSIKRSKTDQEGMGLSMWVKHRATFVQ